MSVSKRRDGLGDAPPGPIAKAPLLGVVLAGGKSSRMGVDKATLPHVKRVQDEPAHDGKAAAANGGDTSSDSGQRSYLEYAIARLTPLVERVAVSGRPWQGSGNVIGLPDEVAELGPAMGVATALRYAAAAGLRGVLVTPVDMPDLATEHLEKLLQAWRQSDETVVVCASFAAGPAEPLLAIYPLRALGEVEQVVASPPRSLSRWLRTAAVEQVCLPKAVSRNVNRPSDR